MVIVESELGMHPKEKIKLVFRQYAEFTASLPEMVVLMRIGEYYAAFYTDAETLARTLGRKPDVLTTEAGSIVPIFRARKPAMPDVLRCANAAGLTLAIAEELEEPADMKRGLMLREIVRIVKPGSSAGVGLG